MSEYLSIMRWLLNGAAADFTGDHYSAHAGIHLADAQRVPLLSAALGPRMLKLAGELTDGTVTYMTGPQTLENHIIPRIRSAAEAAGNAAHDASGIGASTASSTSGASSTSSTSGAAPAEEPAAEPPSYSRGGEAERPASSGARRRISGMATG